MVRHETALTNSGQRWLIRVRNMYSVILLLALPIVCKPQAPRLSTSTSYSNNTIYGHAGLRDIFELNR